MNSEKQDIFIDVYESVSAIVQANGIIKKSEIDGIIVVKCYIKKQTPLKIIMDNDISIEGSPRGGVVLDHYSFNGKVD